MNPRIQSKLITNERRKLLKIQCYSTKIQLNKLSKTQLNILNDYFKQSKYLYNDILNSKDPFKYDYKTKQVNVKWFENNIEYNELRQITLPSQIKQEIHKQLLQNITNLSKKKSKGFKTGKLKFKSEYNTIILKQYNTTYKIKNNKIHIAGIGYIKVNGLKQLQNIKEYGPAKLIKKPSGFYIQITCYKEPQNNSTITNENYPPVGLDFGIKDAITLSTSEKFNFPIDYSKLKKKAQKFSRKQKKSKNKFKSQIKLKKEYEKISNKKSELSNKFINHLKNNYGIIVIQDENIKGWQSGFYGKQVSHGVLGRIKSKLKKLNTTIVIDKYKPTTKLCPICLKKNNIPLTERTYTCSCGFIEDRDTKSARTCLLYGLNLIPMEHRDSKPLENLSSDLTNQYKKLFGAIKIDSLKKEAQPFRAG
jgi:putative transposase